MLVLHPLVPVSGRIHKSPAKLLKGKLLLLNISFVFRQYFSIDYYTYTCNYIAYLEVKYVCYMYSRKQNYMYVQNVFVFGFCFLLLFCYRCFVVVCFVLWELFYICGDSVFRYLKRHVRFRGSRIL